MLLLSPLSELHHFILKGGLIKVLVNFLKVTFNFLEFLHKLTGSILGDSNFDERLGLFSHHPGFVEAEVIIELK